MNAARIARPEIRALEPYVTAKQQSGTLRLNANELPYGDDSLNRYPPIRPDALRAGLARRFAVAEDALLPTRGSSEAIDLLMRTFCRAYQDSIVVTPPTFSMYTVYANMQGAATRSAPLGSNDADFAFDTRAILDACDDTSKLVFLCSPNNPTGNVIDAAAVAEVAGARQGKSMIVIDEAYVEFSGQASLAALIADHDNIVVLRTLSKAGGMAGARCGAAIARPEVIDLLGRMQPPYAFSSPTVAALLAHLDDDRQEATIAAIVAQRDVLAAGLDALPCVERCWPSASNFLLTRFHDLDAVADRLQEAGILIRLFDGYPALQRCARITVGSPDENERLLAALAELPGETS